MDPDRGVTMLACMPVRSCISCKRPVRSCISCKRMCCVAMCNQLHAPMHCSGLGGWYVTRSVSGSPTSWRPWGLVHQQEGPWFPYIMAALGAGTSAGGSLVPLHHGGLGGWYISRGVPGSPTSWRPWGLVHQQECPWFPYIMAALGAGTSAGGSLVPLHHGGLGGWYISRSVPGSPTSWRPWGLVHQQECPWFPYIMAALGAGTSAGCPWFPYIMAALGAGTSAGVSLVPLHHGGLGGWYISRSASGSPTPWRPWGLVHQQEGPWFPYIMAALGAGTSAGGSLVPLQHGGLGGWYISRRVPGSPTSWRPWGLVHQQEGPWFPYSMAALGLVLQQECLWFPYIMAALGAGTSPGVSLVPLQHGGLGGWYISRRVPGSPTSWRPWGLAHQQEGPWFPYSMAALGVGTSAGGSLVPLHHGGLGGGYVTRSVSGSPTAWRPWGLVHQQECLWFPYIMAALGAGTSAGVSLVPPTSWRPWGLVHQQECPWFPYIMEALGAGTSAGGSPGPLHHGGSLALALGAGTSAGGSLVPLHGGLGGWYMAALAGGWYISRGVPGSPTSGTSAGRSLVPLQHGGPSAGGSLVPLHHGGLGGWHISRSVSGSPTSAGVSLVPLHHGGMAALGAGTSAGGSLVPLHHGGLGGWYISRRVPGSPTSWRPWGLVHQQEGPRVPYIMAALGAGTSAGGLWFPYSMAALGAGTSAGGSPGPLHHGGLGGWYISRRVPGPPTSWRPWGRVRQQEGPWFPYIMAALGAGTSAGVSLVPLHHGGLGAGTSSGGSLVPLQHGGLGGWYISRRVPGSPTSWRPWWLVHQQEGPWFPYIMAALGAGTSAGGSLVPLHHGGLGGWYISRRVPGSPTSWRPWGLVHQQEGPRVPYIMAALGAGTSAGVSLVPLQHGGLGGWYISRRVPGSPTSWRPWGLVHQQEGPRAPYIMAALGAGTSAGVSLVPLHHGGLGGWYISRGVPGSPTSWRPWGLVHQQECPWFPYSMAALVAGTSAGGSLVPLQHGGLGGWYISRRVPGSPTSWRPWGLVHQQEGLWFPYIMAALGAGTSAGGSLVPLHHGGLGGWQISRRVPGSPTAWRPWGLVHHQECLLLSTVMSIHIIR